MMTTLGRGGARRVSPVLGALAVLLLAACSDDPMTGPGDPQTVTSIVLAPATAMFAVGATQTLQATPRDRNGATVPNVALTWTSSVPSVASVNGSGVATAAGDGSTLITVTGGGVSASTTIAVSARFMMTARVTAVDQPDREAGNNTASTTVTVTVRP
jgi:uncharacterized protein YjdB